MKLMKIIQNNQIILKKRLSVFMLAFAMICTLITPFAAIPVIAAETEDETLLDKVEFFIDYEEEIIEVYPSTDGTDGDNIVSVMYALGLKGNDAAALAKAKWMPLYGQYLDIKKYIPKKAKNAYYVAFRDATDVATNSGFATAIAVELKARPAITKTDVTYDNDKQQITTSQTGKYFVKLGASFEWIELDKDNPINLPLDFLPNGSPAVFKKAASEADNTSSFASAEIKLKLPKQAKAPKVDKVAIIPPNESKKTDAYLKGVTDKMELMLCDENGDPIADTDGRQVWTALSKNMKLTDLESLLTQKGAGKVKDDNNKDYLFTVRLAASGTKGVSGKSLIKLDAAQYESALVGGSSAVSATVSANLTAESPTAKDNTITITLNNTTFASEATDASVAGIFTIPNTDVMDLSYATYTVSPTDKKKAIITLPAGTYLNAGEVTITILGTALTDGKTPDNDLTVKVTVKAQ